MPGQFEYSWCDPAGLSIFALNTITAIYFVYIFRQPLDVKTGDRMSLPPTLSHSQAQPHGVPL